METILHNAKRKKRKTRKCLDELRKRSRTNSEKNDAKVKIRVVSNTSEPFLCNNSKKGTSNNCITSKRLTLTMFAKAVRSETVTRPIVCEEKSDHNLVLNTKTPVTSPLNIFLESKSSDVSSKTCNNGDFLVIQSDYEKSIDHNENSSDSIVWFSPRRRVERSKFRDSDNDDTISTVTSTSRSHEEFGYHLYEEFVEDIPLYVRRNLSHFIQHDVLKKTRACLQSLYMETLHQDCENIPINVIPSFQPSILTSDQSFTTSKSTIVEDPMDYIKNSWRQQYSYESSPSSAAGLSPTPCSPLAPTQDLVISYTPDYNFYPHRLNE